VLATKVWDQMSDDPADRGLSATQIGRQIDASLARLRTDYVDLYQAHRFDPDVPIEETIEAFQQVVASGKARWPELFVSSWPQYSMLWQAPEVELFPPCAANGISQIVWSPLAQGVLTGKYRPGQAPPPDSRAANPDMNVAMPRLLDDAVLEAVDRLRPVADQAGLSMAELAPGLGAAPPRARVGDHRCHPPRAGPCQRQGLGRPAHPGHPGGHRGGAGRHPGEAADPRPPSATRRHPSGALTVTTGRAKKDSMSEEKIVEVVNEALAGAGIEDTVTAAGEFEPRGHSGAGFAGGMMGGDIGDVLGSAAGGIGTVGGYLAGTRAHDDAAGLPERMVVGVSETMVYGFAGNRAHPKALVFRVPREGLQVKVHQRVNVRVLELIDTESGSQIELEGMRLPITHSKDVIQELTG
jgi:hypothetical protein